MLIASVFAIVMLFMMLANYPFGIFFVLALTLFPGLVFLYLSCVRAGLVALKASGPPNLKKLANCTVRLFRFNIMLNNLVVTLIGIGGSVIFMMVFTPTVWAELQEGFEISDLADLSEVIGRFIQMPLAILLLLSVALSISNGIIGTSSAAVAASAADVGPDHHALWGITRQFLPLALLSLTLLFVPALILVFSLGGPTEPVARLQDLNIIFFLLAPAYLVWAGCAICAGKALAYVQTRKDLKDEWDAERDAMIGEAVPEDNLRELRLKRQEAAKMKDPSLDEVVDDLVEDDAPSEEPPEKTD